MLRLISAAIFVALVGVGSADFYNCTFAKSCRCSGTAGVDVFCDVYDDEFPVFTPADAVIDSVTIEGNFTKVPARAFNNLKQKISLLIFTRQGRGDEELDIDDDAFTDQTIGDVTFFFFDRRMTVPKALTKADGLKGLTFYGCRVEEIANDSFVGFHLERLQVYMSHTRSIETTAFDGLEDTLQMLDLSKNELEEIPEAIKILSKLKTFWMQRNKVTSIDDNAFPVNVTMVDVSDNPISDVDANAFVSDQNLVWLDLDTCNLTEIPSASFQGDFMQQIERLSFDGNHITKVPAGAFPKEFPKVDKFSGLDDNPISEIESGAFEGFTAVQSASFRNLYGLEELDIGIFSDMIKLNDLDFTQCRRLRNVTLAEAKILPDSLDSISITESSFIDVIDAKLGEWLARSEKNKLDISKNVVSCEDNKVDWMKEFLLCTMHPQIKMEDTTCADTKVDLSAYLISLGRDCD